MRIIKYDKNRINIILSFIPKLWKMHFIGFQKNTFMYKLYFNIMFIGINFRIIIYKPTKEISIEELNKILQEALKGKQ